MKKQEMAEAAEQLLVGTGWLPALMRTPEPAWLAEAAGSARDRRYRGCRKGER